MFGILSCHMKSVQQNPNEIIITVNIMQKKLTNCSTGPKRWCGIAHINDSEILNLKKDY